MSEYGHSFALEGFSLHYDSAENRRRLAEAVEALGLAVSFATLGSTFGDLKASGKLKNELTGWGDPKPQPFASLRE